MRQKISKFLNSDIFKILIIFLGWKIYLFLVLLFAIQNVNLGYSDRFLGGGPINYQLAPEVFSWANFDGEHYLSISIHGYKFLEQAFFPVYPMLMSFFAKPFATDSFSLLLFSTISGSLISNFAFFLALLFLWELIRIDFSKKIAFLTIILLLVFPTSFYFGAVYNESLFLLLAVTSFYFARKRSWFFAGVFGAISSATRIFGLIIFPSLLLEAWRQKAKISVFLWIFFIPSGLLIYMLYQWVAFGDPLLYYKLQKIVGEQHQSGLTLLPQVYFRYIKMIMTVDPQNPIYQTVLLEFFVGILFFILPIYGYFKKVKLSYLLYAMVGFLLPTIQGSFSSVPRYVIVFFPAFLAAALWMNDRPKILKLIILTFSAVLLFIETALFLRGYWVA